MSFLVLRTGLEPPLFITFYTLNKNAIKETQTLKSPTLQGFYITPRQFKQIEYY